jgi:hypothetical protein
MPIFLIVLALVFSLAACAAKKPALDPPEGYVVSSREEIRPNDETAETLLGDWETPPGSLQELAGRSDAAVKVRLTAREERDPQTEKYEFALLKDYFDTAKDPIVLYSRSSDFFEPGGVYYLFLTYRDLPVSPLRSYGLASSAFAVREYWLDGGAVLDFRADFSLGLTGDTDMDKTLRELAASMAEEGTLPTPDTRTLEDRLEAAGLVEIVTVTELRPEAGGPGEYYTFADFAVDEVLHGKTLVVPDGAPMMVPIDARAGDRFVLVFGPGAKSPKETADYRVYALDSEEAQTVLEYFGAEVSQQTAQPTVEPTTEPTEPTAAPSPAQTIAPTAEPTLAPDEPDAGLDRIPQSHEDIVLGSTNIVTARYVETVQAFRGDEYVYEVREELKGSAGGEPLHVITSGYVSLPSAMPVSGEDVILFLSGYDSVYQEHVLYILTDIAEDTEDERSLIASLCSGGAPNHDEDGRKFTRSDDIGDILAVTESIFFVRPEEVFVVGTQAPTTTYTCTVLARLRGEPDIYEELGLPVDPEFSEILIPFFNDTVTIGGRYLVLLAEHRERSKIYTLSSPYSVMTQEEAALIPELREIMEKAGYNTPAGNTTLYCRSDSGRELSAEADGLLTPEQAALELAKMYMDGLCTESAERAFRVTEYRNLSVDVVRTTVMDEETRSTYLLSEDEIGRNKWIVEISVEYKYEGVKSPIGPSTGEWVDVLYQGSPVGFLMVRDGIDYSLRSRME